MPEGSVSSMQMEGVCRQSGRVALVRHVIVDNNVHSLDVDATPEEIRGYLDKEIRSKACALPTVRLRAP